MSKFSYDFNYDCTYWARPSKKKNAHRVPAKILARWLRVQKAFLKQQEEIYAVIYKS